MNKITPKFVGEILFNRLIILLKSPTYFSAFWGYLNRQKVSKLITGRPAPETCRQVRGFSYRHPFSPGETDSYLIRPLL